MSQANRRLVRDLIALGRKLEREGDTLANAHVGRGLVHTDALVLGALGLYVGGKARPKDLVFPLLTTRAGVTGSLTRLEKAGLVRRSHPAGDRRAVEVVLTAAGWDVVAAVEETYDPWVDGVVGQLSASDVVALRRVLGKLA